MRDLIKELKENKIAFGLMDKELQDKFCQIGEEHFTEYLVRSGEFQPSYGNFILSKGCTYRLKPDYTEERIELEIYEDAGLRFKCNSGGFSSFLYTNAPALCPKEGYRFVGYRYKEDIGGGLKLSPVWPHEYGPFFPTHAVYERTEK